MKRTRKMKALGQTDKGDLVVGICESSDPSEVGNVAVCVKQQTGKPGAFQGDDLGTLNETDDGHVEFRGLEKDQVVEFEDRTRQGPSKVATKAYRDGWDRIFKN